MPATTFVCRGPLGAGAVSRALLRRSVPKAYMIAGQIGSWTALTARKVGSNSHWQPYNGLGVSVCPLPLQETTDIQHLPLEPWVHRGSLREIWPLWEE